MSQVSLTVENAKKVLKAVGNTQLKVATRLRTTEKALGLEKDANESRQTRAEELLNKLCSELWNVIREHTSEGLDNDVKPKLVANLESIFSHVEGCLGKNHLIGYFGVIKGSWTDGKY